MSFLSNFFSGEKNPLDRYSAELAEVNGYKDEVEKLSQEEMREEILKLKTEIKK